MSKTYKIKLLHLFCYANEELKEDEIFIKYKGKKVWPKDKKYHGIKPGEKLTLDVEITDLPEGELMELEIWDWDLWSANDLLGKTIMKADGPGGPFQADMRTEKPEETARYSIQWKIDWEE